MDRLAELLARTDGPASPWTVVDALVPALADMAMLFQHDRGSLRVSAFAHIDPLQHSALTDFQALYVPGVDDRISAVARVFRTATPALLQPSDAAAIESEGHNLMLRAVVRVLGPRITLMTPLPAASGVPIGVLVTAMSSSGRRVDEDDLHELTEIARTLGPRLAL